MPQLPSAEEHKRGMQRNMKDYEAPSMEIEVLVFDEALANLGVLISSAQNGEDEEGWSPFV